MTRPILYISCPYSAGNGRTVADNIAVARRYAVAAANAGWMPFTPHLNTAHFEVDCPDVSHEEWLAGDLAILSLLDPTRCCSCRTGPRALARCVSITGLWREASK